MHGTKCVPSGRCSNDWKRRNGRLEPLRYFLIAELPLCVILCLVTLITVLYYQGQAEELPLSTIVGTHFSWTTGCADRFGDFASTVNYHTAVTWSPVVVFAVVLCIGVPLRFAATSARLDCCLSCVGGTRTAERFKVGRGLLTCMCALGSGLQFLLGKCRGAMGCLVVVSCGAGLMFVVVLLLWFVVDDMDDSFHGIDDSTGADIWLDVKRGVCPQRHVRARHGGRPSRPHQRQRQYVHGVLCGLRG